MRSLLLVVLIALTFGFSGLNALAAPVGETPRLSYVEWSAFNQSANLREVSFEARSPGAAYSAEPIGKATDKSFAAAAGKIVVLAGAGLIGTLAAVGLARIWAQDPIRYPFRPGSL